MRALCFQEAMKQKLKFITLSIAMFIILLIVLTFLFGGISVKGSPETKEQIEYRELYQELTADDTLTEKEMKQLDEAYKKAHPNDG